MFKKKANLTLAGLNYNTIIEKTKNNENTQIGYTKSW